MSLVSDALTALPSTASQQDLSESLPVIRGLERGRGLAIRVDRESAFLGLGTGAGTLSDEISRTASPNFSGPTLPGRALSVHMASYHILHTVRTGVNS